MLKRLAAVLLTCAPVAAQRINTVPLAQPLTGAEPITAAQGSGCATNVAPCAAVAVQLAQIATFLAPTFQPLDTDLTTIAALTTADFGRQLLTRADAGSVRATIGSTAKRMQAVYATQLRPGAAIWTSGTGSPNGVVMAPVGSL